MYTKVSGHTLIYAESVQSIRQQDTTYRNERPDGGSAGRQASVEGEDDQTVEDIVAERCVNKCSEDKKPEQVLTIA